MGASKCMAGIWTPPQSDKACFLCVVYVQQASKHLPYIWGHPNIWECPHIFRGHQNIGVPKHTGEYPNIWGIQTCRGCPNMGGIQTYSGLSKHMRHPNILGVSKHMGASKHMGGIWIPPQSDKACFICVIYVQQASKHLPNIWGHPNIWGCTNI